MVGAVAGVIVPARGVGGLLPSFRAHVRCETCRHGGGPAHLCHAMLIRLLQFSAVRKTCVSPAAPEAAGAHTHARMLAHTCDHIPALVHTLTHSLRVEYQQWGHGRRHGIWACKCVGVWVCTGECEESNHLDLFPIQQQSLPLMFGTSHLFPIQQQSLPLMFGTSHVSRATCNVPSRA